MFADFPQMLSVYLFMLSVYLFAVLCSLNVNLLSFYCHIPLVCKPFPISQNSHVENEAKYMSVASHLASP